MKIMGFSYVFRFQFSREKDVKTNPLKQPTNNMNWVGSYHLYRHLQTFLWYLIQSWPRNCGQRLGVPPQLWGVLRNAYLYSKMEDRKCTKRICQMISTKLGFNKRKTSGSPTKKGIWPLIVPEDIWRMWQSLSSMQTLQNWTHAFVCTSLRLSKHTFIVSFCLKILWHISHCPKEDSSRLPLKTHGMLKSAIDSPIGLLFAIVAIVYHKNPCTPNWTPAVISFDTLSCKVWIEWHCWVFNSQLAANVIAVIAVIAIVLLFRTLEE